MSDQTAGQPARQSADTDDVFAEAGHDMPVSAALEDLMRTGWAPPAGPPSEADPVAPWAAKRRSRLAEMFPGERLVVPAGPLVVRANDTDFRFRAHSDHVWLSGNQASDGVLVLEGGGDAVLYVRPASSRDTDEFWRDRRYGDLWAGRRQTLEETSALLGLECRHLREVTGALRSSRPTRVLRGVDARVDGLLPRTDDGAADRELATTLSELRLVKDPWEVDQLQAAVDATARGFDDCLREWGGALEHGERWVEGTFWRRSRADGNDVGYSSIVAGGPHATTLHWIDNHGPISEGQLVLLDMGVEARSLYTADVSRTLPASGRFTPLQRDLYELELAAQTAGVAAVRPGAHFKDPHRAAMQVLAHGLHDLGVLPVSPEEALEESSTVHRRWTLHSTSHMLGLDVHDCAAARSEHYSDGSLAPGYVLTVEPGVYFQADDLLVPEELRGIGIRIEDDVLVTEGGARNLSEGIPRDPDAVEAWMASLRG